MKTANMTRNKGQVYSVGNYLMTGKVLGKGHFARVEEATHRIIGKKVAIKIIDLTSIKEEYARRNLHREPRVMAKLRHPCIAALYETMMHGPRLYVVMEAAGGGDLSAHVLGARGATRGLPEPRARALAAQLVSAVRHMHARGVVHRDLKMENIMLDSTKQFIKIVDFGLSNMWSGGAALRTPCGSLEYAAPELFVDGRRYGPEVDLWSIGVIVYGMVTGGLPFTGAEGGEGKSRPQLRAAITRGFTRKQRAALACVSPECKAFIQHLLEPNVELRMKIEEASRHRWVRKSGMKMKTHPFGNVEASSNREIYRQLSELCSMTIMDVVAQIKAEPFGPMAGMYNIKTHLQQAAAVAGPDLLWSASAQEARPASPPEYRAKYELDRDYPVATSHASSSKASAAAAMSAAASIVQLPSPRMINRPLSSVYGLKKPVYKVYDNGDCGLDPRLPSIDEHSSTDVNDAKKMTRSKNIRMPCVRKVSLDEERTMRLGSCPNRLGDKRAEFYRKAGDGIPSWRAIGSLGTPPPRILLQSNATTIKRASLGNIVSPHSSSNSHCKSERAMPVGWYSTRSMGKEPSHLQRLRRTAPMK
ncbi:CBL-interacting serine/threonine-protein kinase 11-like [Trichoplusia ni]|uniref:CBL-interacting serine/threonine-protein kinase 11-like n=1 Tax=Trichoplusia ni TaxID=7111 RepID=A0A7E5WU93_TRINI|nr:CBL-interacting serine/threonine-protein kinase 11-like [Trichoplusia ni]